MALTQIWASCAYCGTAFRTFQLHRKRRRCCSQECAKRYAGERRYKTNSPKACICRGCGVKFTRQIKTKNSGQFHSRECALSFFKLNSKKHQRKMAIARWCCWCGQPIDNPRLGKGYCSSSCRQRSARTEQLLVRPPRACRHCGTMFVPLYSHAFTCSRKCGKARARRLSIVTRRKLQSYKLQKKAEKRIRRARQRGVGAEVVHAHLVFRRDGWRCQLCGIPTPRRLQGQMHPRAPELDHIVPLASGGPHTYANTQCLCRACNGRKGARTLGQLRLAV